MAWQRNYAPNNMQSFYMYTRACTYIDMSVCLCAYRCMKWYSTTSEWPLDEIQFQFLASHQNAEFNWDSVVWYDIGDVSPRGCGNRTSQTFVLFALVGSSRFCKSPIITQELSHVLGMQINKRQSTENSYHMLRYGWWKKSCTSWWRKYPMNYRMFYNCFASQGVQDVFHQQQIL